MHIVVNGEIVDSESAASAFKMTRLRDISRLHRRTMAFEDYLDRYGESEDAREHLHWAVAQAQEAYDEIDKLMDELKQLDDKLAAS